MSRTKHHLRGRGKRRHLWHGKAKHMFKHGRIARDWARAAEFRAGNNPDGAPLELCALNPRKDGRWTRGERKSLRRRSRRSWEDPYAATLARDDLALEMSMSRRSRRNCGRNPRRGRKGRKSSWRSKARRGRSSKRSSSVPSAADWRGYEKIKRALRVNPGRNTGNHCPICSRPYADASSVAHVQDGERPSRKLCYRLEWDDAICNAEHRRKSYEHRNPVFMNPRRGRRNPKRDGSPTRGEKRKAKYVLYLKTIAEKGQNARADIAALTGEVTKPDAGIFKPIGKRVLNRVMKGTGEIVEASERVMEIAPRAAEAVPADVHPEIANIKSRLSDIDSAIEDLRGQVKELESEGDDELNEEAIKQLHEEIAKFAKQKKLLRERMDTLKFEPATATNPHRRGRYSRRCSPRKSARIAKASRRAARSIRILRQALRRARRLLRS